MSFFSSKATPWSSGGQMVAELLGALAGALFAHNLLRAFKAKK